MDDERAKRAKQRAGWPGVLTSLAEQPHDDLSALSVSERVALVWQLTLDAWAMMGKEIPTYPRSEMPGTVLRRRDAP